MRLTYVIMSVFVVLGLTAPVDKDPPSELLQLPRDVTTNPYTFADLGVNITSTNYTPSDLSTIVTLLKYMNGEIAEGERGTTPITCETSRASPTEFAIHVAFQALLEKGRHKCHMDNIFPTSSRCTTFVTRHGCSISACKTTAWGWQMRCDFVAMYAQAIRHRCRMWDGESKAWKAGGKAHVGPGDAVVQIH